MQVIDNQTKYLMTRYLDPKNDVVFKKIFGEYPLLLKDFLNALLPLPDDGQIIELSHLQLEQVPVMPLSYRRGIVDVKCIDQQGRTFIVEMQMFWTTVFRQRMLFNASQAYVQQLAPGQDFRLLQPVNSLGLINDVFDPDGDWYHHYKIVNIDRPQRQMGYALNGGNDDCIALEYGGNRNPGFQIQSQSALSGQRSDYAVIA
jgi:hypothetical protein